MRTQQRWERVQDQLATRGGPKALATLRPLLATLWGEERAARFALRCQLAGTRS